MKTRTVFAAGLTLLLAACATASQKASTSGAERNTITQDQIREYHFTNAYDAVAALHSNWLHLRGADSFNTPGEILVYYDNTRLGGTETLRSITASAIVYIRFFDGISATNRWGVGHSNGVIFVSSRVDSTE